MLHFTPEDMSLFLAIIGSVLAVYGRFKGEAIGLERRLTVLEEQNKFLQEFKESASTRLNNHEEQNKALLVLAEQVKMISEDMKSLSSEVKTLREIIIKEAHQ